MEIKPIDLLNKSFNQRVRGYDKSEVDEFMRQVTEAYEASLTRNARLSERVEIMEAEIQRYKDIENSLNSTLVLAQKTSDDMRANAKTEADLIVREAKSSAAQSIEQSRSEIEELRKIRIRFETEMRAMLRAYLEMCEDVNRGGESGITG
ncbi:MAG: DivIVA domain-containing protein [Armatimonadota bacterium]